MMNVIKKLSILLLTLICFTKSFAQEEDFNWKENFLWDVDFYGLFDNREFKAPFQTPQTIFGARITPEIGIKFLENNQVNVGISWKEDFGEKEYEKVKYVLYYKYDSKPFKITFGSFPRRLLTQEFPNAVIYDSLLFDEPLIQGVLLQYQRNNGYSEIYIDWKGQQDIDHRERFTIASNGRYYHKNLMFLGWNVLMNHYAKPKNSEGYNVVDNFMLNPYVGVNFADLTHRFDSLELKVGALASLNRDRGDENWHHPIGMLAEFDIEWKGLGLNQSFYWGQNQLSLYDKYGSSLHFSDPFYRARTYSRTDIYYRLFRKSPINLKALFNVHVAEGKVQFQQQVVVGVNINKNLFKKR